MSAGASPQTPLGELTALPQTSYSEWRGWKGRTGAGKEGKSDERGEWERERGKLKE